MALSPQLQEMFEKHTHSGVKVLWYSTALTVRSYIGAKPKELDEELEP